MKEFDSFCPLDKKDWREWLKSNHTEKEAVWLILYKKGASKLNLSWSEAVDEALCFGWIDSVKKTLDSERYIQYFCKRKPKSTWSKVNKEKIKFLLSEGLMAEAGLKSIEIAKQNGSWTILDSVEALEIPSDLEEEFIQSPQAKAYYISLSKSIKKGLLYWVISAKRPETRQKRINEIVECAKNNTVPKQIR